MNTQLQVAPRTETHFAQATWLILGAASCAVLSLLFPVFLVASVVLIPFIVIVLRRSRNATARVMLWIALSISILSVVFGTAVTLSLFMASA
ncbi:hypothetical protein [Microbacterium sp. LWH10-1.2]|uniref:hypothetical protein n=1 Tax=unclassified Microbacterium TaxID=2609290 RepID=UPI003139B833